MFLIVRSINITVASYRRADIISLGSSRAAIVWRGKNKGNLTEDYKKN